MYISKLNIHGFKSFLNKTELTFGEGITTVVGPNGCGKSNIVDAIRWILGEQKIRTLRTTKMEDVIFNGAKFQKPLGFCEVSLTIHNNKGRLPIEYTALEITRRYYRSGESEYLMNRVPCRLKDITNLFLDSGMGADAYSVIELKMIDSILSQNPVERRRLFEEAAGINHYKMQRQSAIRKLETTRTDLDRIRDIISEVDTTVRNLRLQLKRFERHKKLSAQLESSEILLAQARIQMLDQKLHPLQEKEQIKRNDHQRMSGQMDLDESLVENLKRDHDNSKQDLELATRQLRELESGLQDVNSSLLVAIEQKKAHELRIQQYADEKIQTSSRIDTLAEQNLELNEKLNSMTPHIEQIQDEFRKKKTQFEKIESEYDSIQAELNTARSRYDTHLRNLRNSEGEFHRTKAILDEKQSQLGSIQETREVNGKKRGTLSLDLAAVQQKIKEQERVNGQITLELEKLQETQTGLEDVIVDKKELLLKKRGELSQCENQHKFLKNIVVRHEGKAPGTKYICEHPQEFDDVQGLISDVLTVDQDYRKAVETALGDVINAVIVTDYEAACRIIEQLHNINPDYNVELVPLAEIPDIEPVLGAESHPPLSDFIQCGDEYKKLFRFLLGHIVAVEHPREVDIRQNYETACGWVTMDGEVMGQLPIVKSGKPQIEPIIGRSQKIQKLSDQVSILKDVIVQLNEDIRKTSTDADDIRKKVSQKSLELDKQVQQLNICDRDCSRLQYSETHLTDTIKALDRQYLEQKSLIGQFGDRYNTLGQEIRELQSESARLKNVLENTQKKTEVFQQERNRHQQQLQDARIQLVEVQKEQEGYRYRLRATEDQKEELQRRIRKIQAETETLIKKVEYLSQSIKSSEVQKNGLLKDRDQKLRDRNSLEERYNKLYEELQNLQHRIRHQQKIREDNLQQIQQFEIQIADLKKEKEFIVQRIQEKYQCGVPSQVLNLDEINVDELSGSIESIDRSLARIGPVNMAVEDEYNRENERLSFLQDQLSDLVEAESDVVKTIEEIDGEARSKFRETFAKVSENFKNTYAMFFEGGEAHIRLSGSEDPLEAEIQIIARPPGKKTKTLRMLSAGEKALTAIAMLFAIYLVKPSPFCILDEVDAPLDDNNIGKFTSVLRQFSNETQFIVVTHNKLTMEEADYLYGVTQQEEGVSTVVSVNFRDNPVSESATA